MFLNLYTLKVSENATITVQRRRNISISRELVIQGIKEIQICSVMDILNGFPIAYEADGEFELPHMTAEHVLNILQLTGRDTEVIKVGERTVTARVNGTLSGRYIIGTASETGAIDKPGLCTSLFAG
jgi:hypothetical protein